MATNKNSRDAILKGVNKHCVPFLIPKASMRSFLPPIVYERAEHDF